MSFFGEQECYKYDLRKEQKPTDFEWLAAELWVRYCYSEWFRVNQPSPNHVTWELDRLFSNVNNDSPVFQEVIKLLDKDFKSILSLNKKKILDIMKNTTKSDEALMPKLYEIKMGGNRKPDMLGISVSNILLLDAVEVSTAKTADETWSELQSKLDALKNVIVPQLKLKLPELNLNRLQSYVQIPNEYIVKGSSFRLSAWQRILPLPIKFDKKGKETCVEWICYNPTMNWKPPNAPMPTGEPQGTDGIILYHIHSVTIGGIPKKVKVFLDMEIRKWKQGHGLVLDLNPAYAYVFKESKSDWSPEARKLFAYFGIGALVMIGVAVAWEIGVIEGAAVLAKGGLSALMASPPILFNTLGQCSMIARNLWLAGSSISPFLPIMKPLQP
ncbi:hypothetical protein [Bacillus pacificus]|uniref:hypothetical protein n=1 Tax=Bacillus pacificus TaxID=2026187 RepID=UPI002E1E0718|nr:hypothetical protein [Bacillus pacificus]